MSYSFRAGALLGSGRLAVGLKLVVSATALSCAPEFDVDLSDIEQAQVLAVRAEPAEVQPGQQVLLSALVAGAADSSAVAADVEFGLCTARKELAELGPVAPECLQLKAKGLQRLGEGSNVQATMPEDACSLFGPKRPDPKPGEPAGRPADPDPTGGYYQPVIARIPAQDPTLGGVRLACGLQRAEREQVAEYNLRFTPNVNPRPSSFELRIDGRWSQVALAATDEAADAGTDAGDAGAAVQAPEPQLTVAAGTEVDLRVRWKACARHVAAMGKEGSSSLACGGAEAYLLYDAAARLLEERREDLVLSWYASAGELVTHRTAPTSPSQTRDENTWRAPSARGVARLWVVVRDGRGGVGWASVAVNVR